ncbi:MAG: dihydropteroate synthase [Acidobacteria bacterium]|nr:dihydropteroate synthase [Acidobacteriota bacterium]
MGILNVTPDSFSERGTYFDRLAAIARGLEIEREGADLLDIGGESTRPGAEPVSEEEELERTVPVIETLRRKGIRIPISIDTYKWNVAEKALRAGAEIVNDVSGLRYDPRMASVVATNGAAVVLMHLRGTPRTMQKLPALTRLIPSIRQGLAASVRRAVNAGIRKRQIVLDPGIGFGKSSKQNFEIIANLRRFSSLGFPILTGPSRKSFIRQTVSGELFHHREHGEHRGTDSKSSVLSVGSVVNQLRQCPPEDLLFGTAAAVAACILNGANIVRVHDVKQMVTVARITDGVLACRDSS